MSSKAPQGSLFHRIEAEDIRPGRPGFLQQDLAKAELARRVAQTHKIEAETAEIEARTRLLDRQEEAASAKLRLLPQEERDAEIQVEHREAQLVLLWTAILWPWLALAILLIFIAIDPGHLDGNRLTEFGSRLSLDSLLAK